MQIRLQVKVQEAKIAELEAAAGSSVSPEDQKLYTQVLEASPPTHTTRATHSRNFKQATSVSLPAGL